MADSNQEVFTMTDGLVVQSALQGMSGASSSSPLISNPVTGQGTSIDPLEYSFWVGHPYNYDELSREAKDLVYLKSAIAQRECDIIPTRTMATFRGWSLVDKEDNQLIRNISNYFLEEIYDDFLDAAKMGNLYGDAFLVLLFDDGQDLREPLDISKITDFYGACPFSRYSLTVENQFVLGSPAAIYQLDTTNSTLHDRSKNLTDGSTLVSIHASRVLHFPGRRLNSELVKNRNGYNQSRLEPLLKPLSKWLLANSSAIDMVNSHSTFLYKMKNLAWKTSTKDTNYLTARFQSILEGLNSIKALVMDADQEDGSFIQRRYQGVDTLIEALDKYLVAHSDIPKSFLLNAESSFSSDSAGDRYTLAQMIDDYKKSHILKPLRRWFELFSQLSGQKLRVDEVELLWDSPLLLTRKEESDIRFKNAQTDAINYNIQAYGPETVRTRWEDGHYSDDITLKEENWEALMPQDSGMPNKTIHSTEGKSEYTAQDVN
jgi:hypothetical protein